MFYNEALTYIDNIERAGSNYGTARMRELLILLGEPDKRLKFVHIAGTNGKGSVCAYLTSIFVAAGLKVGTYNSPSVFSYNERFLINGENVSDESIARYMSIVRAAIENETSLRLAFGLEAFLPTAFEIETAIAFLCFYEEDCNICVLETGLGGRLDATNVIENKELAVITTIGLEHCALLGNTLAKIAAQKAAIIKNKVVTYMQSDEVMSQISSPYSTNYDTQNKTENCALNCAQFESQANFRFDAKSRQTNAKTDEKIYRKAEVILAKQPKLLVSNLDGQTFEYGDKTYTIKLLGEHQLINASLAIAAAEALASRFEISNAAIENGLEKAVWRVRFEIVKNPKQQFNVSNPLDKVLVLDGAHNPQGAGTLNKCLKFYFSNKRISLVIGVLADKDVEGIVKNLAPLAYKIYTVTPPSPRALNSQNLKKIIDNLANNSEAISDKITPNIVAKNDVRDAVQTALNDDGDIVVLCGSLTLFSALNRANSDTEA